MRAVRFIVIKLKRCTSILQLQRCFANQGIDSLDLDHILFRKRDVTKPTEEKFLNDTPNDL